ncbi:hypothetical protein [Cellulomonas soli]|uniref:Uncharacterized protein n=1 Tax=Cellulomonas soli TaxID=931535 RepID=A0A512P855_9CELL|nr:hypothetical protein [Cellulomonas soli]NYI57611.1 hypothetical protein [Cellulomonas soli]GEP67388.1 hypothetical protein CSO01_01030 [Cellulomonas soli]
MSVIPARPHARPLRRSLAVLAATTLAVGLGSGIGSPALADDDGPVAGTSLPVVDLPAPEGGAATPMATIESAEEFCGWLSGIYDSKPSSYTVRTINCRSTDVFVKGVYRAGGFGPCVLVPARHSRHLGGSLLKPIEKSQIC